MENGNLRIKSLRLENFKSYSSKKINLNGDIVIFTGPNGAGKTSILEAIFLLSTLKSFRGAADKDLIRHGEKFYRLEMGYETANALQGIGAGYGDPNQSGKVERRMQFNNESIPKISQFIGKFQTVVFAPDDINIIEGGPQERRRFTDILLSTLYPDYLVNLQNYKRLLKFRSSCFHKLGPRTDEKYIEALDVDMIRCAAVIQEYRKGFIDEFQEIFKELVQSISHGKDSWKIIYSPSVEGGQDRSVYAEQMRRNLASDIKVRQTQSGVHRDKILFLSPNEGGDIVKVGSQGQKRTLVLALKMAQYLFTQSKTRQKPVLLIDDVLNELDVERRKKFINFLHDAGQVFIATTDIAALKEYIEEKKLSVAVQIFNVGPDQSLTEGH